MTPHDIEPAFNEAQLELLKLFKHYKVDRNELADIKQILAAYFMDKARNSADRVWKEKEYNTDTINKWLHRN
ncbi:MAG TPA: hypothetical protein VFW07_18795 [Parafilimonas sp.]|nr:hypothetical protein [Parafilimonas sp.]